MWELKGKFITIRTYVQVRSTERHRGVTSLTLVQVLLFGKISIGSIDVEPQRMSGEGEGNVIGLNIDRNDRKNSYTIC